MNKYNIKRLILTVTILFFSGIITANASTIYFESSNATSTVGDTLIIHARINTEGVSINAIEGIISLTGMDNAVLRNISVANSDFTLWPEKPSFTVRNNSINFSGGIPGGVVGKDIKLFDLILEVQNTNDVSIKGNTVNAYLNDGSGTTQKVIVESAKISSIRKVGYIPNNEWLSIVNEDKNPPHDITVEYGKDTSAYDGKTFISINAKDEESGIAYFEVKEGDRDFVRTGSPYVLQDQDIKQKMVVRVVDNAGNKEEITLNEINISVITIILVLIAGIIIVLIFTSTFKKK